jgi:hypothetical protein
MRISRSPALLALPFAALAGAACSLALATDADQCTVDADCEARGFTGTTCVAKVCVAKTADDGGSDASTDPKWGCIGHVDWPAQDKTIKVLSRSRMVHAISETGIAGIDVKVCDRFDPDCAAPLGTAKSDAEGYVTVEVPKYFAGFLELTPPAGSGLIPSLAYVLPPPDADQAADADIPAGEALHIFADYELNGLLSQIDATADPTLGHLFALTTDCTGRAAAGVTLHVGTVASKTISYYSDSTGLPSLSLTATSTVGEAGYVNLPTGVATLTTFSNEAGKQMGSYSAVVRKGTVTYIPLPPSP